MMPRGGELALRAPPALLRVEKARQALAECRTLEEARQIRDLGKAMEAYARSKKAGVDAQVDAAEIVTRAMRRMGELELERPKAKGAKGVGPIAVPPTDRNPTQRQLHGSKQQAFIAQTIAKIPEKKFEAELASAREKRQPVRASALARAKSKEEVVERIRNSTAPPPQGPYRTIAVDPPWRYACRADDATHRGRNVYPDMSVEEICALPVAALAGVAVEGPRDARPSSKAAQRVGRSCPVPSAAPTTCCRGPLPSRRRGPSPKRAHLQHLIRRHDADGNQERKR
jgi:hypothetical protein